MSIDYVTDGHVARLTINRPAAMNALDIMRTWNKHGVD
jgi:enoyl-CoA hydratase/carnithine racemase